MLLYQIEFLKKISFIAKEEGCFYEEKNHKYFPVRSYGP